MGTKASDLVTVTLTEKFRDEASAWIEDTRAAHGQDAVRIWTGGSGVKLTMRPELADDLLSFAWYGCDGWGDSRSLGTGNPLDDARMARIYKTATVRLRNQLGRKVLGDGTVVPSSERAFA